MSRKVRARRRNKKPRLLKPGDTVYVIRPNPGSAIISRKTVRIECVERLFPEQLYLFPAELYHLGYHYEIHRFSRTSNGLPLTEEDFDPCCLPKSSEQYNSI